MMLNISVVHSHYDIMAALIRAAVLYTHTHTITAMHSLALHLPSLATHHTITL